MDKHAHPDGLKSDSWPRQVSRAASPPTAQLGRIRGTDTCRDIADELERSGILDESAGAGTYREVDDAVGAFLRSD